MQRYSRNDWIFHSHFHPVADAQVLIDVVTAVEKLQAEAGKSATPVILFDLDSTLYEVGPRTHAILKDWNAAPPISLEIQHLLNQVRLDQVGYSLQDTFEKLGLDPHSPQVKTAVANISPYWWDRFFANTFLHHDRPYPGAMEFANLLYKMGCHLIYLTGREEAKMKEATEANLKRDKFPFDGKRTRLVMKPHQDLSDVQHKVNVADIIKETGTLIASFENEPVNLVSLAELFPEAMHVFVETVASNHPAPPGKSLFRIRGFKHP